MISHVRATLGIREVAASYGLEFDASGRGRCPFPERHTNGDAKPSLRIDQTTQRVKCWSQGCIDGDIFEFVQKMDRVDFNDALDKLIEAAGVEQDYRSPAITCYEYHDPDGSVAYRILRQESPKAFRLEPKGETSRFLYRVNEALQHDQIVICEGEKCVDVLWSFRIPATCNPFGAGNWSQSYSDCLIGKHLVVWPDKDPPGFRHAETVAQSTHGLAGSVRLIEPPADLGPGSDVADLIKQGWTRETVLELISSASPWSPDERPGAPSSDSQDRRWTVAELLEAEFPDVDWAVPGLVPCGLTILAGRPKIGKSWLTLQLASAVGTGGVFLGQQAVEGPVLVYALEDSPRRLQSRLSLQRVPTGANVIFSPMKWDGWDELDRELSQTDYRLVIVDTISRTLGEADQNDTGKMTSMLATPQRLALQHNTSILIVDHHRKSNSAERGIDDLIGSTAKSAVADAILQLYREQGKHDTYLQITGRDIEAEKALVVKFDQHSWQLEGDAAQMNQRALREKIIDAIHELSQRGLATNAKKWSSS